MSATHLLLLFLVVGTWPFLLLGIMFMWFRRVSWPKLAEAHAVARERLREGLPERPGACNPQEGRFFGGGLYGSSVWDCFFCLFVRIPWTLHMKADGVRVSKWADAEYAFGPGDTVCVEVMAGFMAGHGVLFVSDYGVGPQIVMFTPWAVDSLLESLESAGFDVVRMAEVERRRGQQQG